MPLYEYRCNRCQESFEVLQRLGEGSDCLTCSSCGSDEVERQLSTFAGHTGSGGAGKAAASCGSGFS